LEQKGLKSGSTGFPQIGQAGAADILRSISFIANRTLRLDHQDFTAIKRR
jgi:hypothetical protein